MIITKKEPKQLMDRQCAFFAKVVPKRLITKVSHDTYNYSYIPGVNASSLDMVLNYLQKNVWKHSFLVGDRIDNYVNYLSQLEPKPHSKVLDLLETLKTSCQLVHGDATLENFLQTKNGITCIDPGMPRGFCNKENDIGKILQSYLTNWQAIRHGSDFPVFQPPPPLLEITNMSIASLISHWHRIIKNHARHPQIVRRYGLQQAIPVLTKAIEESDNTTGYRWLPNQVREIYCKLLPKNF